mmetsp:Transcript_10245/g.17170  ORF Transcript_10245/g.17170 Transcript_10245/m.17170 type:complete len:684 (+) Transcript_10245:127-2178(+)
MYTALIAAEVLGFSVNPNTTSVASNTASSVTGPEGEPIDLALRVCSVNGVSTRQEPEPWRPTVLSAIGCDKALAPAMEYCWKIQYLPRANRLHPVPPRMPVEEVEVTRCFPNASFEHMFTFPGEYRACVTAGTSEACVTLKNRYVHRHVMSMTQQEFDEYAHALNTLRSTSTVDGRATYGHRCLDADEDFYTHDAFVALHFFGSSANRTSADRLHYLVLQEPAHQAWTMLVQKAIRCVSPAASHPFFDPVHDASQHYTGTLRSLLDSPVWGPERYGSRANHETVVGNGTEHGHPYYVTDGRFANFTISQTQGPDYWCEPLLDLSGPSLHQLCRDLYTLRHDSMFSVGISLMQPKPASLLEYVSRRPYFFQGSEFCIGYISELFKLEQQVRTADNLEDVISTVSIPVHSFGHECISGKWTHNGRRLRYDAQQAMGNNKAVNIGMWFERYSNEHPCFRCEATRCTCTSDCKEAERWYEQIPDDRSQTERVYRFATTRSLWQLQQNGCDWPRSGTFDWSASANQDPAFYMHHYYTFYFLYLGLKHMTNHTGKSAIDLWADLPKLKNKLERPGNNIDDATVFRNLIPYRAGQVEGSHHTWRDIIEYQSSLDDFTFEEPPKVSGGFHFFDFDFNPQEDECIDNDEEAVLFAARRGITITSCSQVRTFCRSPLVAGPLASVCCATCSGE